MLDKNTCLWGRTLAKFLMAIISFVALSGVNAATYWGQGTRGDLSHDEACKQEGFYRVRSNYSGGVLSTLKTTPLKSCGTAYFPTCLYTFDAGSGAVEREFSLWCRFEYKAVLAKEIPPLTCEANAAPKTVANPIEISTGSKIQPERIEFEGLPIDYVFRSSGIGQWQQKSDQINKGQQLTAADASTVQPTKALACEKGFIEIRDRAPADSWLRSVTAEYSCETCLLKKNGQVVSALAIVEIGDVSGSVVGTDVVQLQEANGAVSNYFSGCSPNEYKSFSLDVNRIIKADNTGNFHVLQSNGKKIFSPSGKLSAILNSAGMPQYQYEYDESGNLKAVKNQYGQVFTYNYEAGLLNSIQAPSGKLLRFNYKDGLLTKLIHPDQTTRIYHYEDSRFPSLLTGITDERGVRYATWKYDALGRAISSEHAGGAEKSELYFNTDGSTTVTNTLGKKTTFSFTDVLGVRKVNKVAGEVSANCAAANQAYTYTPQGRIETKTDWNGHVTRFTYDSYGRELTRTYAFDTEDPTTVQTCWHSTLNQPSRIIEPARVIVFDYTTTGQTKSQTIKPRPLGVVDCSTLF